MLKKFVFAAALVVASSPAFVSAQDFFFSFDENSAVSTSEVTPDATSGTVFLFGGADFDFNQLDLNFTSSDSSVAAITGGVVFNPGSPDSGTAATANGGAFTSFALDQVSADGGRLFATSFLSPGQQPGSGADNFREGAGGFLLAAVDYDIVGEGTSDLAFTVGPLGVVNDGEGQVEVSLGTGSITVADAEVIPEPSSAILLILGAAGMAARRRRS